jgi:hypothetical protein
MDYLERLTSGSFKKDEAGRTVFYPWGAFGKGRILPDRIREAKVRSFMRLYYKAFVACIIGVGVILGWTYSVFLLPVLGIWFYFETRNLTSGLPFCVGRLAVQDSYANTDTAHDKPTFWLLFICSSIFIVAGLWIALDARNMYDRLMGGASILFFGACAIASLYMIKTKCS